VNEAHEHIAELGAVLCFVAQRVFAVQDGHLEAALANIIVQGRPGLTQEQGLGDPNAFSCS
jgi:hypothetical protein